MMEIDKKNDADKNFVKFMCKLSCIGIITVAEVCRRIVAAHFPFLELFYDNTLFLICLSSRCEGRLSNFNKTKGPAKFSFVGLKNILILFFLWSKQVGRRPTA
jgi:hypothetical protein